MGTADGVTEDELLSLAEAAHRHGISEGYLRDLLIAGSIPGARKVRGKHGLAWRVTSAGMKAAGWEPADDLVETPAAEGPDGLTRAVRTLAQTIDKQRQELERIRDRYAEVLASSTAREAGLKAELKAERNRRRHAEGEVRRLTKAKPPTGGLTD